MRSCWTARAIRACSTWGQPWRLKYRHAGKEKRLSLGTYPDTTLKTARERRDQARKLVADGIDPSASRQAEKERVLREVEHDFETVARAWVKHQQGAWTAETKARVVDSLVADIFKPIGPPGCRRKSAMHALTARREDEQGGAILPVNISRMTS